MKNIALKIVMANVGVFFLQLIPGFTQNFLLIGSDLLTRPWIIFTSMFMHADLGHLFFNMYALLLFGPLIEQRLGSKRFLYFYLGAGAAAAIVYGILNPIQPALGASGAIMGVIGLTIMLLPQMKILFFFVIPMSMRTAGFVFAAIDIFGLFTPGNGVANLAHLVGLAAGLIYGRYLVKQKKSFHQRFTRKRSTQSQRQQTGSTNPNDVVIELNDTDVNDYLKNGKL